MPISTGLYEHLFHFIQHLIQKQTRVWHLIENKIIYSWAYFGHTMKRKHEEIARQSFACWLNDQSLAQPAIWQEVRQENEPPDWYMDIREVRYAIEATSIVDYIWEFDPPLSSVTVLASMSDFVTRVENHAKTKGPLNGGYLIELAATPNFRKQEQRLFDKVISYIDGTRHRESAEKYELYRFRYQKLHITKHKSDQDFIDKFISCDAKLQVQAQSDLQRILSFMLEKKSILMQNVSEPVILLLLDAYYYSHITNWAKAISTLSIPSKFESIFRTCDKQAQLLYSRTSWWRK